MQAAVLAAGTFTKRLTAIKSFMQSRKIGNSPNRRSLSLWGFSKVGLVGASGFEPLTPAV
jgi:hypothetical protein